MIESGQAVSATGLPPFQNLLKSREVEDPVNLWMHRPLAYSFVALTFSTSLTPNAITLLAMTTGIVAGSMWLWGTPVGMVLGGILLWASAILDGADGIMARAKKMHSEFGRALDGAADAVVAFATVVPAVIHLWQKEGSLLHMSLVLPAILFTLVHLFLYDYYKEAYLRVTQGKSDGEDIAQVQEKVANAKANGAPFLSWFTMEQVLLPMLQHQQRLVAWTNPLAEKTRHVKATPAMVDAFRKHNQFSMKAWSMISLAPHSYLLAICGMMDRIDLYFWIRLIGMNVAFIVITLMQRRATKKTLADWDALNA